MNTTDNVATIYTNMTLDREQVNNYSISVQANIQGATPDENNLPEQTGRRKRRQAGKLQLQEHCTLFLYKVLYLSSFFWFYLPD